MGNPVIAANKVAAQQRRILDTLSAQSAPKIIAYHGSPRPTHFDRFDASKIGTGEGAQAYGHGLYFAQSPAVAADYRRALSLRKLKDDFLDILPQDATAEEVMESLGQFDPRQKQMLTALAAEDWLGFDYPSQAISQTMAPSGLRPYDASADLAASRASLGTGYQVELGVPEESLLDWDAPVVRQAGPVADYAKSLGYGGDVWRGQELYRDLGRFTPDDVRPGWTSVLNTVNDVATRPQVAAARLMEAGIPGIRYFDANSRSAGQGTRNYVMFPGTEDRIRILRKYGLLGPAAVGAAVSQDGQ
jgi:hypothetical protein